MRGRKVPNGFWVFDYPDSLIIICYKDGSLGFPFRVPHRSATTPAFLHAIRAAGLRVFGPTTLVADPTDTRCVLLLRRQRAERHETANEQENKNNPPPDHPFPPLPPPRMLGVFSPSMRRVYFRNSRLFILRSNTRGIFIKMTAR